MGSPLAVEVAYAGPDGQWLLSVAMPPGSTIADAIIASRIEDRVPGLAIAEGHVGVFGNPRPLDTPLRDGDRVEIYRPLLIDPKQARRARIPKR